MRFKPGQKVVRIGKIGYTGDDLKKIIAAPIKGSMYTVKGYSPTSNDCIYLEEIPVIQNGEPVSWEEAKFREIDETDTIPAWWEQALKEEVKPKVKQLEPA